MTAMELKRFPATDRQLESMIETLADYICATRRPRAALDSAVAVLAAQVRHTHRAARLQVKTFTLGNPR